MSLELRTVGLKLTQEAYDALVMLAEVNDRDLGEEARLLLTEILLGKVHAVRVVAARLARATKLGNGG
jgi:hypothetical protein